jgi:hypothetical protein
MNTDKATPELFAALAKAGGYFLASPAYPDYLATPEGRVFSIRSRRFLRPMRCGKYLAVGLRDSAGIPVRRYVHRFVAELTHGHAPAGLEVCHIDGDRDNNAESNLRWDTRKANHADKRSHGTDASGERNPMARLTAQQVSEIRQRAGAGVTQRKMCAEYGVSPMTISRAVRGETWRHV